MWNEKLRVNDLFQSNLFLFFQSLPSGKELTAEDKREESFGWTGSTENLNAASCGSAVEATRSEVLSCKSVEEEEYDSDEERLRVYRKVKMELDEDEEERLANEVREGGKMSNNGQELRGFLSLVNDKKSATYYADSDTEEEKSSIIKLPAVPAAMIQQSCEDVTDNSYESESAEDTNTSEINVCQDSRSSQSEVFSTSEKENEVSSKVITKPEEETFLHNEDIDDNEPRKIYWTTFRLPTQQTETLDDRLHLFSGGASLGFQAEVAAKASAASRNFWMAAKSSEKTFGGVGEGEVFGTDSDEETGSDGDAEENWSDNTA